MLIPFFFVWSAFFLGPAMVTRGQWRPGLQREPELPVYARLTKVTIWMLIIYFIVKIIDLNYRGVLSLLFNGSFESNMFLLEMVGFVAIPIIMYAIPSIRNTQWGFHCFVPGGGRGYSEPRQCLLYRHGSSGRRTLFPVSGNGPLPSACGAF